MAVLMTSRWSTRTLFCYLILECLICMRKATAVGVLSERDDGRGIQGKLDEKFLKNARESFYSVAGGALWNTSTNNFDKKQDDAGVTDVLPKFPPVMDKPGIFFPDNINPWSLWSACTGGVQTRTRGPEKEAKLLRCGHLECVETRPCQSPSATPGAGQWQSWGQWTGCVSEGNGRSSRVRVRVCREQTSSRAQSDQASRLSCPGLAYERVACESQVRGLGNSAWTSWSQWSSCNGGGQSRTRSCSGAGTCLGSGNESKACSLPTNSVVDRAWGTWFPCTGPYRHSLLACRTLHSNGGSGWSRPSQ